MMFKNLELIMSLTQAQKNQLFSKGLQDAQEAINADKNGNYQKALRLYISAAESMNILRKSMWFGLDYPCRWKGREEKSIIWSKN